MKISTHLLRSLIVDDLIYQAKKTEQIRSLYDKNSEFYKEFTNVINALTRTANDVNRGDLSKFLNKTDIDELNKCNEIEIEKIKYIKEKGIMSL